MREPIRILLQATIPVAEADWHVGWFSMLRRHLEGLLDKDGLPMIELVARDRATTGLPDPVLSRLGRYAFDQLWLVVIDQGNNLEPEDCEGIDRFRRAGGEVMAMRGHIDQGFSVSRLPDIHAVQFFDHDQIPGTVQFPPVDGWNRVI